MTILILTTLTANTSFAFGGAAAAASAAQEQENANKAGNFYFKHGINYKVFRKAEAFIKEKFPNLRIKYDWQTSSKGFYLPFGDDYYGNDYYMILKWNGNFEVGSQYFWTLTGNSILHEGNWTRWLE